MADYVCTLYDINKCKRYSVCMFYAQDWRNRQAVFKIDGVISPALIKAECERVQCPYTYTQVINHLAKANGFERVD